MIDDFLDKNPAFANKPRTVNPAGRCASGKGGETRTPAVCTLLRGVSLVLFSETIIVIIEVDETTLSIEVDDLATC